MKELVTSKSLCVLVMVSLAGVGCGGDFEPSGGGSAKDAGPDVGGSGGTSGTGGSGATGGTSGSGGTSATGGVSGSDAGESCPSTHRCVPPAPADWTGPVALSEDVACPAAFADETKIIHTDLQAATPVCDCACTPGVTCPTSADYVSYSDTGCSGTASSASLTFGSCKVPNGLASHAVVLPAATKTCSTQVNETIPAPTWGKTHRLCGGGTEAGQCDEPSELCLPGDAGPLCVFHPDDTTCPSGYPEKLDYFESFADTRDCPAACSCTSAGTAECTSTLFKYSGAQCTGLPPPSQPLVTGSSECLDNTIILATPSVTKTGTCTGETLTGTGSATPTNQITVCCRSTN